jgi:hypothetical protein
MKPFKLVKDSSITFTLTNTGKPGKPNSSSLSFPFLLMLLLLLVLVLVHCGNDVLWKGMEKFGKSTWILPYLLKDLSTGEANHVGIGSTDITYIPMGKGFIYLVAIIGWYSRSVISVISVTCAICMICVICVISREVSTTLEKEFCIRALEMERALSISQPQICNSDQGCQFTNPAFYQLLADKPIAVSMDGCGRAFDNIIIEGLWRSVTGINPRGIRNRLKFIYFQKEVYQEVSN